MLFLWQNGHDKIDCKWKTEKFRYCGKVGHLKVVCREKKKKTAKIVKQKINEEKRRKIAIRIISN